LIGMFILKVIDNMLGTAKTLLVQRDKAVFAALALGLSNFIYLLITKDIVMASDNLSLVVVSVASGVGCCFAVAINNKFSKDRTYVNVLMSDNPDAMKALRDFLAYNHITNVATDSYTRAWDTKTITITAYAETKEQSRLIDKYIEDSAVKFKRVIQKV